MIHLNRREKRLAIGMAVVVAVWAVYGYAIRPTQERIATLERVIPEKQSELEQLRDMSDKYIVLQRRFEAIRTRLVQQDPTFELLPFLENLIERHELTVHLQGMKQDLSVESRAPYAETSVAIDLEGISLAQLVRFLEALDTADIVAQIGSLHIHKSRTNEGTLASKIQIVSPRLAPNAVAADHTRSSPFTLAQ